MKGKTMTATEAVAAAYNVARGLEVHGFPHKYVSDANVLAGEALTHVVAPKVYDLVADTLDKLSDARDITAADIEAAASEARRRLEIGADA